MLTREQNYALFAALNRYGIKVPKVRKLIADVGLDPNPESDVARLLHHVAYGDIHSAKIMLDANPQLINKANHVVTPSGLHVRYVKPYECAFGAGDADMAEMIAGYFDQFIDGAEAKAAQDAKYRPHIERISKWNYQFRWILDIVKQASIQDVKAELEQREGYESVLRDAMRKFREEYTPDKTRNGLMHYSYQDVQDVLSSIYCYWDGLEDNPDKRILVCRQLYGYVLRNLPAIDRMAFAESLHSVVEHQGCYVRKRSFKLKNSSGEFPVTADDATHTRLGVSYFIRDGQSRDDSFASNLDIWTFDSYLCKKYVRLKGLCAAKACNDEVKRPSM